jgi:hypothetical protein
LFPLIKLAKKLKVEHARKLQNQASTFPLIKLAKKLKAGVEPTFTPQEAWFPLIKLAKKLKETQPRTNLDFIRH